MSSDKSQAMEFGEFCKRLNDNPEYMRRYREDPGRLVEEELKITLSKEQRDELKETVNAIFAAVPDARLYIAGEKFSNPREGQGPVVVPF